MLRKIDETIYNPKNLFCVQQCIHWLKTGTLPTVNAMPTNYEDKLNDRNFKNQRALVFKELSLASLRPGLYKTHEGTSPKTTLHFLKLSNALVLFECKFRGMGHHAIAIRWERAGNGQLFDPNSGLYEISSVAELLGVCGQGANNDIFSHLEHYTTTVIPVVPQT